LARLTERLNRFAGKKAPTKPRVEPGPPTKVNPSGSSKVALDYPAISFLIRVENIVSKLSHDLIMAEGRIDQLKAENSDLLDRLQKLTTSEAELKARSSKLGGGLDKVKNLLALKLTRPDVKDDPSRQKIVYRKKIFQLTIKDLFDRIAAKQPKAVDILVDR